MLAAASVLLLLGLSLLLYKFSNLRGDYQQLAEASENIQQTNKELRSQVEQSREQMTFLTDEATQEWLLSDPQQAEQIKAKVYWNPKKQR